MRLKRIEENKAVLRSLNIIQVDTKMYNLVICILFKQAKEELHQLQKPKTNPNPTSK